MIRSSGVSCNVWHLGWSWCCRPGAHPRGKRRKAEDEKIVPELDRVTLKLDGREVKPLRVLRAGCGNRGKGRLADGLRPKRKGVVRALGAKDNKEKWSATAPKDIHLAWLNSDDSVIYLAGFTAETEPKSEMPLQGSSAQTGIGQVAGRSSHRRKGAEKQSLEIQAAVPTRDGLAVLI